MMLDWRARRYRGGRSALIGRGYATVVAGVSVAAPSAATGQNPRASRYRFAYQLSDVIRMIALWL